jgi:hypothetical protein
MNGEEKKCKSIISDEKLDKALNKVFWVVLIIGGAAIVGLLYYVYCVQ